MSKKFWILFIICMFLYSFCFTQEEYIWTKDFMVESHHFESIGSNTYFILEPNYYLVLENSDAEEHEKLVISVLNRTKIVDGLETLIVEERETVNDEIIEVSRN